MLFALAPREPTFGGGCDAQTPRKKSCAGSRRPTWCELPHAARNLGAYFARGKADDVALALRGLTLELSGGCRYRMIVAQTVTAVRLNE